MAVAYTSMFVLVINSKHTKKINVVLSEHVGGVLNTMSLAQAPSVTGLLLDTCSACVKGVQHSCGSDKANQGMAE